MKFVEPTNEIERARKYVQQVYEHLRFNGVEVWLDAGSLLKAYRRQDFIDSSDIDFGIRKTDYQIALNILKQLENEGYRLELQAGFPLTGDLIKVYFPGKDIIRPRNIDIYFYSTRVGEVYRKCFHKPSPKSNYSVIFYIIINKLYEVNKKNNSLFSIVNHCIPYGLRLGFLRFFLLPCYVKTATTVWTVLPHSIFDSFLQLRVQRTSYLVPRDIEQYLEYRYGPRWAFPDKNWRPTDGSYIQHRRINY
jgi:hypothetical protein